MVEAPDGVPMPSKKRSCYFHVKYQKQDECNLWCAFAQIDYEVDNDGKPITDAKKLTCNSVRDFKHPMTKEQ